MSYDIWTERAESAPAPHPDCRAAHAEELPLVLAEAGNMTSNVAPVWRAAGCDLGEFDGKTTDELRPAAQAALDRLKADPRAFDQYVRGGGSWGTVESAIDYLERVVAMCDEAHGIVWVSR